MDTSTNATMMQTTTEKSKQKAGAFTNSVLLTGRFVLCIIVCVSFVAFAIGRECRLLLLLVNSRTKPEKHKTSGFVTSSQIQDEVELDTVYSSKVFDLGMMAKASCESTLLGPPAMKVATNHDEDDEEGREPSGYLLTIDMQDVETSLLDSTDQLKEIILGLVESKMLPPMLSLHCQSYHPGLKSCVGISTESHIALNTSGRASLLPIIPILESLFMNSQDLHPTMKPRMKWAQRKRGFRAGTENPEEVDVQKFLLNRKDMETKQVVASVQSNYQQIDIYDTIDPRHRSLENYARSLSRDGSYEARHPDLFRPDRTLYLDNILQSTLYGDSGYHEALVHPAMFSHPNPKRVAIIGGGEGATLREVLKHNTVETVTMIEIDNKVTDLSRKYLPKWSDCSDLVTSSSSCFDDPRAEILHIDAISWIIEQYGIPEKEAEKSDLYDVIIMDALDPDSIVEFSDLLYNNTDFVVALSNALSQSGILVSQVGECDETSDPPVTAGAIDHSEDFIKALKGLNFESIKEYNEAHGGLHGIWSFLIAFSDASLRRNFYANEAEFGLKLKKRAVPTISGKSPFCFFDGPTMMTYQFPCRLTEDKFCLAAPSPPLCDHGHGFDPELPNAALSDFTSRKKSAPSSTSGGLFFGNAVPRGTYVAIEEGVHDVLIMPSTHTSIQTMLAHGPLGVWRLLEVYEFCYGFATTFYGGTAFLVNTEVMSFANHRCNGTNTMDDISQWTLDANRVRDAPARSPVESSVYSPFIDRNHMLFINSFEKTNEDAEAGAELIDMHHENWTSTVPQTS